LRGFCLLFKQPVGSSAGNNLPTNDRNSVAQGTQLSKLRSTRSRGQGNQEKVGAGGGGGGTGNSNLALGIQQFNVSAAYQSAANRGSGYGSQGQSSSGGRAQRASQSLTNQFGADLNQIESMGYQVEETYCFCQNISYGDMVACDHPNCRHEWFHFPCVGLTKRPEVNYGNSWYCPECLEKVKKG